MKLVVTSLVLLSLPLASWAHHSRTEFTGQPVREFQGELTQVLWFNPHAALVIKVADESGRQQLWRIETFGSPRGYLRWGITGDLFRVGERVTVAGQASRLRENYVFGTNALLADGTEVILGLSGRRWNGDSVVGEGYDGLFFSVDEAKPVEAAAANKGLFRVWSVPRRGATRHEPFTQEALAARELWDVANNPIARCEKPGMPGPMMAPTAIEFVDEGARLTLRTVWFDTVRTIHLADAGNADDQPATPLGYSVGRWEGRTLIVDTARIDYPYYDSIGTPQSAAVRTVERFTLSEDQSRLDFELTIADPLTFTEPATYSKFYLALDEPFSAMECNVF